MTYSKLKKDLVTALISIKRLEVDYLLEKDIEKNEVIEDLTRFMLFFEELEEKESKGQAKYSDFTNQFNQIAKYLKELSSMLTK